MLRALAVGLFVPALLLGRKPLGVAQNCSTYNLAQLLLQSQDLLEDPLMEEAAGAAEAITTLVIVVGEVAIPTE